MEKTTTSDNATVIDVSNIESSIELLTIDTSLSVKLTPSGFISITIVETQRVNLADSSKPNKKDLVFTLRAYVKDKKI